MKLDSATIESYQLSRFARVNLKAHGIYFALLLLDSEGGSSAV